MGKSGKERKKRRLHAVLQQHNIGTEAIQSDSEDDGQEIVQKPPATIFAAAAANIEDDEDDDISTNQDNSFLRTTQFHE